MNQTKWWHIVIVLILLAWVIESYTILVTHGGKYHALMSFFVFLVFIYFGKICLPDRALPQVFGWHPVNILSKNSEGARIIGYQQRENMIWRMGLVSALLLTPGILKILKYYNINVSADVSPTLYVGGSAFFFGGLALTGYFHAQLACDEHLKKDGGNSTKKTD